MKFWKLIKKNWSPIFIILGVFLGSVALIFIERHNGCNFLNLNWIELVNLTMAILVTLGIVPVSVYRNWKKKAQENLEEFKKIKDEVENDIKELTKTAKVDLEKKEAKAKDEN